MEEEYISAQNNETSNLHKLLRIFGFFIETNQMDENSNLINTIFQEFVNSRDEPINPEQGYIIRWSETILSDTNESHVIHYEISFEPQQVQELIDTKKLGVREATEHLKSYKKIKADDDLLLNKEVCPICYDEYKINQYKRILDKCGHIFHKKCVDKWFVNHPNLECPMCRTNYNKE